MRVLLLVNPVATALTAEKREAVHDALAADHDLAVVETTARDHATELASEAAAEGVEVVVVLGGDGTYSEVANGLAGTSTALATIPAGSTNVFPRTVGWANDAVRATDQLRAALMAGTRRRVDLGKVNDRYFLFHVGVGFDAAVVQQVEKRMQMKRRVGQGVFVYATFLTWFRHYDRTEPSFSVRLPGGEVVDDGYFAICLKTNPYTYLGKRPFDIAPEAGFDRGLALVAFRSLRFTTLIRASASALRGSPRLRRLPDLVVRPGLEAFTITGDRPFPYQADGDYLGRTDSLELSREPACLDLVVPT